MDGIIAALTQVIVDLISVLGYGGICLLMAIESACIPLPSEIIMPFAGYLVSTGRFDMLLATTAGALGCNVGSEIAYRIGSKGGRPAIERWGRLVLVGPRELAWSERVFHRFGGAAVFVARLLPVVRTFIALPAGLARMPRLRFHLYTFAGSWLWCLGLTYAGARLGERWRDDPTLRSAFHRADAVIAILLLLGVGALAWHRLRHRKAVAALGKGDPDARP